MNQILSQQQRGAEKRPFVVALTGGIASGKTTISDLFHQLYHVDIIDADRVARYLVDVGSPALADIVNHFGHSVLTSNGALNRAYLRERIFNDESERAWLNQLLHPLIRQQMYEQIQLSHRDYVLAVIPLLVETEKPDYIDFVLVVDCAEDTQYQRLVARDHIDRSIAKNILAAQATRAQRLSMADGIINNDACMDTLLLSQQVCHWHQFFLTLVK